MKKTLTFLIASLVVVLTQAQITLTSDTHIPTIGETYNYSTVISPQISSGSSGMNQVWDLSSLEGQDNPFGYIDLLDSGEPSTFPEANLIETFTGGENYYSTSTDGISIEGHLIPGFARIVYSDEREFINFPISFGDTFNNTFSGSVENILAGQTFQRSGTIVNTADSYGDLILPYGTINNVLRVVSVVVYSDLFNGFEIASYNDTIFTWYNATTDNFIASMSYGYVDGTLSTSQATILSQDQLVSVNNTEEKNIIAIYPNPAKDIINISNLPSQGIEVNIIAVNGQVVYNEKLNNNVSQIDISKLSSGVYIMQYYDGNNLKTQKLIIE